jgi:hypothetical protein
MRLAALGGSEAAGPRQSLVEWWRAATGVVGRGAPWRKKMRTAVMVHAARRRRQRGPAVRPGGGGGGGGVRGEGTAGDDVWMRN